MASLAGAWIALVAGFGGLRDDDGYLELDPHLPEDITRLRFRLRWRGLRLIVDVDHDEVHYAVEHNGDDSASDTLSFRHAGADLEIAVGATRTIPIVPRRAMLPVPTQPLGCAPQRRRK